MGATPFLPSSLPPLVGDGGEVHTSLPVCPEFRGRAECACQGHVAAHCGHRARQPTATSRVHNLLGQLLCRSSKHLPTTAGQIHEGSLHLSAFSLPSGVLFTLDSFPLPSLPPSCAQNRQPFVTRDVVLWSELAQALTNFFACGTGRGLTQDNLRFLACKLIPNLGALAN